jgi:hypothetical protein
MTEEKYIYHGTSAFYLPYIEKKGINGKYPDELYELLLDCWHKLDSADKNSVILTSSGRYARMFLERQQEIRQNNEFHISLTKDLTVAKEYANGKPLGEGPMNIIVDSEANSHLFDDNPHNYNRLEHLFARNHNPEFKQLGIILAFKISDIQELYDNEGIDINVAEAVEHSSGEFICHVKIPYSIIHIVVTNKFNRMSFPLLSDENAKNFLRSNTEYFDLQRYLQEQQLQQENFADEAIKQQVRSENIADKTDDLFMPLINTGKKISGYDLIHGYRVNADDGQSKNYSNIIFNYSNNPLFPIENSDKEYIVFFTGKNGGAKNRKFKKTKTKKTKTKKTKTKKTKTKNNKLRKTKAKRKI